MDIAVCLDCTSSVAPSLCEVRERIVAMIEPALRNNGDIRLALIEFRSRNDSWVTIIHPFTHSAQTFQHWLNNTQAEGGSQDGTRAIGKRDTTEHSHSASFSTGDALMEVLRLDWRSSVSDKNISKMISFSFDQTRATLNGWRS